MTAQELRIGNWIQDSMHFNGYFQVVRISESSVESPDYILSFDEVNAIPLTPEWLERFGFNRCDNITVSDSFYWIRIGASEFAINPDNGIVWITTPRGELFNNPALITHVHQLQNLYFALTGQELELK